MGHFRLDEMEMSSKFSNHEVVLLVHWWDEIIIGHGIGRRWWFRASTKHRKLNHKLNPTCHNSHLIWRKVNGANLLGVSSSEPITKANRKLVTSSSPSVGKSCIHST